MYVCMYVQHGRWGFWIPDTEFQSLLVKLGFWITIVSGIPDSSSCIPDLKAQDSEFHKQKVPGFRIPQAKNSRILESRFPYMGYERGEELARKLYSAVLLSAVLLLLFVCFFVFFPSMLHLTTGLEIMIGQAPDTLSGQTWFCSDIGIFGRTNLIHLN